MSRFNLLKSVLLLNALTLPFLLGCSPQAAKEKTFDWKEEIQLHDGRKIIAERLDTLGGRAEPGQEGAPQQRRIVFPDPSLSGKTYAHTITGSSNYLLLDFDKGVPWLIVHVGPFSTDTRCPIGTYETFTMKEGKWQSVSYAELPKVFTKPNMAVGYKPDAPDERKAGQLLTATQINKIIELTKQHNGGVSGTTWRLVQTNVHGRPIDCQAYPDKPTASNTSTNATSLGEKK